MSLQYGVPLEVYVKKFSHTRFEPMGHTKNADIRIAKSIVDYIFRWLGIQFLPGFKEAMLKMPEEPAGGAEALAEPQPAVTKANAPAASAQPLARPAKPAADADLLERAGVAMQVDQNGGSRHEQFASFQVDAPSCDNCGSITVRNGNCYLCYNCGNSMGCS
jgi:ribonucleoside-diphosphate reductase alpha chain